VFRHVYVGPDETVDCGTLLGALTGTADEAFDAEAFRSGHEATQEPAGKRAKAALPAARAASKDKPKANAPGRGPITPAARRRAKELGVDVGLIAGSGPGGRVTREDVDALAAQRESLVSVADGVGLEVPSEGTGDTVLLLPGFGSDASSFAPLSQALSADYQVRGVNPRGVGASDAPEDETYSVKQMAADAASLCEAPAHVIGASLGSAVALEMALSHPERVRSLVLVTPFLEAGGRLLAVLDLWSRLAAETDSELQARALLPWFFSAQFLSDAKGRERAVRGLAAMMARVPAATLERSQRGLAEWSGTRSGELDTGVPTLVIAASEDLLTPRSSEVADAIVGAKCCSISGAGHGAVLEAPGEVAKAVRAHLELVSGE
jgi:3-oxoadipate enol-lactonase